MDNAQKAIMIGVGLFITIIIIAAVMVITGMGQDLINKATQRLGATTDSLSASEFSQYDGTTMTGSEVISTIKSRYKQTGLMLVVRAKAGLGEHKEYYGTIKPTDNNGQIQVNTGADKAVRKYYAGTTGENKIANIGKLTDTTDADTYVKPSLRYNVDLIYLGSTDNVIGIYFHLE